MAAAAAHISAAPAAARDAAASAALDHTGSAHVLELDVDSEDDERVPASRTATGRARRVVEDPDDDYQPEGAGAGTLSAAASGGKRGGKLAPIFAPKQPLLASSSSKTKVSVQRGTWELLTHTIAEAAASRDPGKCPV